MGGGEGEGYIYISAGIGGESGAKSLDRRSFGCKKCLCFADVLAGLAIGFQEMDMRLGRLAFLFVLCKRIYLSLSLSMCTCHLSILYRFHC